jgi:hypothetical protein
VTVDVGVAVGVAVDVAVGVAVGVAMEVAVGVAVGVAAGVVVGVAVGAAIWQLESASPLSNLSQSSVSAAKPAAALQLRQRATSSAHCARLDAVPALPEHVPGNRLAKSPSHFLSTLSTSLDSTLAILLLESASMAPCTTIESVDAEYANERVLPLRERSTLFCTSFVTALKTLRDQLCTTS